MNRRAHLRSLLAEGQSRQVIQELLRLTGRDSALHAEAAALSARYQQYLREKHGHTASSDELAIELNRINAATLHLIGQLPEEAFLAPVRDWRKLAAAIGSIILFGAAVAEFSGYSLRDLFQKEEPVSSIGQQAATIDTTRAAQQPAGPNPAESDGGKQPAEKASGPLVPPPGKSHPKAASTTPADTALAVFCRTDKGRDGLQYKAGETMRLYFRATQPCYLRIIYRLADGSLVLFDDDRRLSAAEAGSEIEIGDGYEATEPFGEETLYVFAQSAPFAPLQTRLEDGYRYITEGLPSTLSKTRGFKKKNRFAEDSLVITTYR